MQVNIKGQTHFEVMTAAKKTCNSYHLTFGGRCLNCGWEPKPINHAIVIEVR